jgi:hypothetical protein
METPLYTALIAGGVCLCLLERRADNMLPWSAVVLAAAAMTRPEALIVVAVSGVFKLGLLIGRDSRAAVVNLAVWGIIFAALYGSYFLWRVTYYDEWLPNTYYAKVGSTNAILDRGIEYVQSWGLRYHVLGAVTGSLFLLLLDRIKADVIYVLGLTAALLAAIAIEGGDAFPHGRFVVPLLPLLYLAGVAGYAHMLKRLSLGKMQAAAVAGVALVLAGLALTASSQDTSIPAERANMEERQLLGRWLSEYVPEDYTIAAYAVGALGYHAEQDVLDLLGVNDVTIAHTGVPDLGKGIAGHEKYNTDYVFDEAQPELIVPADAHVGPMSDAELRDLFSGTSLVARDIYLHDPRLWERYAVRSVEIEGRWFNFLQRRDTVADLQAPGLQ